MAIETRKDGSIDQIVATMTAGDIQHTVRMTARHMGGPFRLESFIDGERMDSEQARQYRMHTTVIHWESVPSSVHYVQQGFVKYALDNAFSGSD